jgi:L-seryl-tRNA(Ser) seleniumtransferase
MFETFGVTPVINAAGTVTRLSGGIMAPEVAAAMTAASAACFDITDLQAAASREIARATRAEAGIVTSGASAALLLGAAACLARLDPGAMNRLPDTDREIVVLRGQRNMYDRALRVAGARIVEVGIPDRHAGPGMRDAAAWEVAEAIGPRTAAIHWLAGAGSEPPLGQVVRVAREAGVPVLVDAAAQLPPAANLRRFVEEGADLVCFSGGKAVGGPQASGILAGRRDLVSSALAQMLDLDLPEESFAPPPEFAPLGQMRGLPHHGIGRSCKAGKEEIVGLLTALRRFVEEDAAARTARLRARLDALGDVPAAEVAEGEVPLMLVRLPSAQAAREADARLRAGRPAVHVGMGRWREGVLVIHPAALSERDLPALAAALRRALG